MAILQTTTFTATAHRSGSFHSPRVRESSGVAVSRAHRGILWTHNDSGDGPFVYATDTSGADLGALRVPGAMAIDWEDMALGPCPTAAGDCLYFADTGDNYERRPTVVVYAVPEPEPPRASDDTSRLTSAPVILHLRYADGPADVEAVYVTPDGSLYLVTKGRSRGVRLYGVPRSAWGSDTLVTAEKLQDLQFPAYQRTTGAAADGAGRVVVRTYRSVHFFDRTGDGRLIPRIDCDIGRIEEAGEGVAFLDASTLVLTSEANRRAGTIDIVRCP